MSTSLLTMRVEADQCVACSTSLVGPVEYRLDGWRVCAACACPDGPGLAVLRDAIEKASEITARAKQSEQAT